MIVDRPGVRTYTRIPEKKGRGVEQICPLPAIKHKAPKEYLKAYLTAAAIRGSRVVGYDLGQCQHCWLAIEPGFRQRLQLSVIFM